MIPSGVFRRVDVLAKLIEVAEGFGTEVASVFGSIVRTVGDLINRKCDIRFVPVLPVDDSPVDSVDDGVDLPAVWSSRTSARFKVHDDVRFGEELARTKVTFFVLWFVNGGVEMSLQIAVRVKKTIAAFAPVMRLPVVLVKLRFIPELFVAMVVVMLVIVVLAQCPVVVTFHTTELTESVDMNVSTVVLPILAILTVFTAIIAIPVMHPTVRLVSK